MICSVEHKKSSGTMVRGNIRARRDHMRGPRATFRKAFLPRPPFDLARFDLAFQKDTTPSADDNDLTNVSVTLSIDFSFINSPTGKM